MLRKTTIFALISVLALVSAPAHAGKNKPVGTWLISVSIPDGQGDLPALAPFQQLITFGKHGAVSETNSALHANSAVPGGALNFNGSDGYGEWEKKKKMTHYKIVKLLFDGITNEFLGYMVITGSASVDGDVFTQSAEDSNIELVFGADPLNPDALRATFGGADAIGHRVTVD